MTISRTKQDDIINIIWPAVVVAFWSAMSYVVSSVLMLEM
jgi:hypothetical protein